MPLQYCALTALRNPTTVEACDILLYAVSGLRSPAVAQLSNIPLLFGLLGCETSRQLLYYQSGIGCYTPLATPVGPFVATSRLLDKAIAWSVDEHVREGYRFCAS